MKNQILYFHIITFTCLIGGCGTSENLVNVQEPASIANNTIKFSYQDITGIGLDKTYNRRDNSDIIKVGNKHYIWYTRMHSPITSGDWGTIWYATSEDEGFTWQEQGMALGLGAKGEFDQQSVFTPNILTHKGKYYLYYTGVKPTLGNGKGKFENNAINDTSAIGLAVANSPTGPFLRVKNNPVLKISSEPADFDSFRIDDASLLVKDESIWLYYKGRSLSHGKKGPKLTQMGVAHAHAPEGPFVKHSESLLKNSHEVLIWGLDDGVASLASINKSINFSHDGIRFTTQQKNLFDIPKAPGLYRPHLEEGNLAKSVPGWGVSMKVKKGVAYLVRFEM